MTVSRSRKWPYVGVLVSLVVSTLLISNAGAASKHSTTLTTTVNLKSRLLRVTQLPSGWTVVTAGSSVLQSGLSGLSGRSSCVDFLTGGLQSKKSVQARFVDDAATMSLTDVLLSFVRKATKYLKEVVEILNACHHYSGKEVSGTFRQMAFPKSGKHSAAYSAVVRIKEPHRRLTGHGAVVLVSTGSLLVVISELGHVIDVTKLSAIVHTALGDAGWSTTGAK